LVKTGKKLIDSFPWAGILKYDESSCTGLRWVSGRRSGKEAGGLDRDIRRGKYSRYRIVKFGQHFLAHRIIWYLIYGSIDSLKDIDHIDGNACNNKIENLRLIDKDLNRRNSAKRSDNKSGKTGVRLMKDGSWESSIKYNHEKYRASFTGDDSFELACSWRDSMIKKLNSEFSAGFTDRHGVA